MEIENLAFSQPWEKENFVDALRQRNVIGLVCETPRRNGKGDDVVAYMLYELALNHINLLSMAVHPSCWRRGVGSHLFENLRSRLKIGRRTKISAFTSSANYRSHLFLKACGMRCTEIVGEDYEFCFDLLDWAEDPSHTHKTDGRTRS